MSEEIALLAARTASQSSFLVNISGFGALGLSPKPLKNRVYIFGSNFDWRIVKLSKWSFYMHSMMPTKFQASVIVATMFFV